MIYVSTSCLKRQYISETVRELAESGIGNIELSGGTKHYDGIRKDLVRLKQTYGLNYACHAYFPPPKEDIVVNLASCNDEIYEKSVRHYENCLKLLPEIGCHVLSVHAGFLVEIRPEKIGKKLDGRIVYDEEEAYRRFCTAYKELERKCAAKGITLYLENNVLSGENYREFEFHNYLMMTDYASVMRMKRKMEFNLLLDLGHLHVSAHTLSLNYEDECGKLRPYVKWLHVSDNDGITDLHVPLKDGSAVVRAYLENDFRGVDVTLETKGTTEEIRESMNVLSGRFCAERR